MNGRLKPGDRIRYNYFSRGKQFSGEGVVKLNLCGSARLPIAVKKPDGKILELKPSEVVKI